MACLLFDFMLRVWLEPVGGERTTVSGFPAARPFGFSLARPPPPDDGQNRSIAQLRLTNVRPLIR